MKKNILLCSTLFIASLLTGCVSNDPIVPPEPSEDVIDVENISLNVSSKTLDLNESFKLQATITPDNATYKTLVWSKDNDHVSFIENNDYSVTVTAESYGTTVLTVKDIADTKSTSCVVTVRENTIVDTTVKAYIHDEHSLIESIEQLNGESYTLVTDSGIEEGVTYFIVKEFVSTRVKLVDNGNIKVTGLNVNGEDHVINNEGYVSFVSDKGDDDFLSLTPTFIDNTPHSGDTVITIHNSEHLTLGVYANKDSTTSIDSANIGETIYVRVSPSEDIYFAREIQIKRITSDTGNIDKTKASVDASDPNLFSFTVPYSHDKKIDLTPIEGNNALLRESELPGEYLSLWLTNATHSSFEWQKFNVIVEENGKMYRADNSRVDQIDSYKEETFHTESYADIPYGKNYIFTSDAKSTGYGEPFTSYDLLCIKKEHASDADASYSVVGERFIINSKAYFVFDVKHNGENYFTAFVDVSAKKLYTGVTFNMLYGDSLNDAHAIYQIKENDNVLLAITYVSEGGYTNRAILTSPFGVYTNSTDTLVLANDIAAVYQGVSYFASYDGNTVTLKNASRQIVFEIDITNGTFSVISDEEVSSNVPNLRNYVFTGTFVEDEGDGWVTTYDLKFTFADYADDEIIQCRFSGYHVGSTQYWADLEGTYDLDTNIITFRIVNQAYNWVSSSSYTLRVQVSNGKITMLNNWAYVINFRNYDFVCADFHM